MRKNKNRTLILSLASATAVLPGCGDSSETTTSSTSTDASHEAARVFGSIAEPAADASSDQTTGVITTGQVAIPPDAGDGPGLMGAAVQPPDAGDANKGEERSFPGVIIRPEDGSANG